MGTWQLWGAITQPPEGSEEEDGLAGRGVGEWKSKVSGGNQDKEDGPKGTIGMVALHFLSTTVQNCSGTTTSPSKRRDYS